jgi:hypothetical protein
MTKSALIALVSMAIICPAGAQVSFTRILEGEIAKDTGPSMGCAWGDYDNDGYPDLVVADAFGAFNRLYHNNGDGTFSRVTEGPIVNDPWRFGCRGLGRLRQRRRSRSVRGQLNPPRMASTATRVTGSSRRSRKALG